MGCWNPHMRWIVMDIHNFHRFPFYPCRPPTYLEQKLWGEPTLWVMLSPFPQRLTVILFNLIWWEWPWSSLHLCIFKSKLFLSLWNFYTLFGQHPLRLILPGMYISLDPSPIKTQMCLPTKWPVKKQTSWLLQLQLSSRLTTCTSLKDIFPYVTLTYRIINHMVLWVMWYNMMHVCSNNLTFTLSNQTLKIHLGT